MTRITLAIIALLIFSTGCYSSKKTQTIVSETMHIGDINLFSPAFDQGGEIPARFTCDGKDANPPLMISEVPENAKSLVLIMDDPDAPAATWNHWILFNIAPEAIEIEEGTIPNGALQGLNSFNKLDYGGPCPPNGEHHYRFKLYALDNQLSLPVGASKKEVESAMQGHILAKTTLVGVYSRI